MSTVTRADWHVSALSEVDLDVDPFDVVEDEYDDAVAYGQPIDLDLVARALGPIDLTADDTTLLRWANELERRDASMLGLIQCPIRTPGACLACPIGDEHLADPGGHVVSVLCRNSRRLELVEQEVDARLSR